MNKEEYIKEKASGNLNYEYLYEYYKAHRDTSKKELDLGEFTLTFQQFVKFPVVNGTDGRPRQIDRFSIFKKVSEYFDNKYGIT